MREGLFRAAGRGVVQGVGGLAARVFLAACSAIAVAATVAAALGGATPVWAGTTQPNIIFILLDDAGYADFGATGSGFIQTPRIDALAQESVSLTRYYANAPLCSPTRVSLMTGEYSARMWMRHNGNSSITTETLTMPQVLAAQGYATGHVGKWDIHSNAVNEYIPSVSGFDFDVRFRSTLAHTTSYHDPWITIGNTQVVQHVGEHLTAVLTDYAIDFVTDNAAGPFFLQLWHWAPHVPLEPPPDWAALYPDTDEGKVGALISDVDEEIGRLLDTLDALGLADDTLVVVTNDNGGSTHTHHDDPATGPSNSPFRGGKQDVYEGGIRVPFFARWPNGGFAAGTTNDSTTMGFDLLHTFAEVAGADLSGLGYPGTSMIPALEGAFVPRADRLFWERKSDGDFYVDPEGIVDDFAVLDGDWKLVRESDRVRLFNIAADPGESNDRAAMRPGIVNGLLAANQEWRLETGTVAHAIEQVQGPVDTSSDVWVFSGGQVELENNPYYDIRAKDFSFLARITPSTATPGDWQLIAKRSGSWDLILLANNRLRLIVYGKNVERTVLSTSAPLELGQSYDVAFTVFAWIKGGSSVRLYLDGQLEAETFEIDQVDPGEATIKLGSNGFQNKPFFGELQGLRIYSAALRPHEIDDLFAGL